MSGKQTPFPLLRLGSKLSFLIKLIVRDGSGDPPMSHLSSVWAAVAQWLEWVVQYPEGRRFDSHSRHSKTGETDSWRGVSPPPFHGRGALEQDTVPPCSPGAVISCPPLQCMASVSMSVWPCACACVFNRCQPGWVKSEREIVCISVIQDRNLVLIFALFFHPFYFSYDIMYIWQYCCH